MKTFLGRQTVPVEKSPGALRSRDSARRGGTIAADSFRLMPQTTELYIVIWTGYLIPKRFQPLRRNRRRSFRYLCSNVSTGCQIHRVPFLII
ncbi:hypothetical protein PUN28_001083 [Cardiocondyla obscurior]|uniref:Uncharacterized protein n=1 Tax=Cardiocondyla obscurior TaxID=286306 RepID=A0AAW2H2U7_9HYME